MMHTRNSLTRFARISLKAFVTCGLGWFIIRRVQLDDVGRLLAASNLTLVVISTAILMARLPLSGHRWRLLLERADHRFGTMYLTRVNLMSHFFVLLLPGNTGADIARGYHLFHRDVEPHQVVSTVLADRVAGIMSMILLSLPPALWIAIRRPDLRLLSLAVTVLATSAVGIAMWLSRRPRKADAEQARNSRVNRLARSMWSLADDLSENLSDWALVGRLMVLSVLFQAAGVVATSIVGRAVGAEAPFVYYVLLVPLIWLWTTVPISIGGLGVREGGFVFFFGLVGMAPEKALAISLIVFGQSIFQGLLGGFLLLAERTPQKPS